MFAVIKTLISALIIVLVWALALSRSAPAVATPAAQDPAVRSNPTPRPQA